MMENNVMEFCQWLVSEKGIDAGNLSEYINNNEDEVLKLAEEFKKPKFKVGGKVESAAEMFKCGGKAKKKKSVKKCETGGPQKIDKDGENYSLKHTNDGITEHLYLPHNYEAPGSKIATRTTNLDGSREYSLLDDGVKYQNNDLDTVALRKKFDKAMASARNVYPAHKKWGITPWEYSYMAAPEYDLPMRPGIEEKRVYKKVQAPSGETREYVVKSSTRERTEKRTTPAGDVSFVFGGKTFVPGDEMFDRYQSAFKAYGLQKGGEIKKESITLGKAKYSGYNDSTGKYKEVAYPQDTTWVYRSPDGKMELTAMPTDYGYVGYKIEPGGDSRILTPEEASLLREQVKSRIKNIPHKDYLINRYGKEMMLPENFKSNKK